jgi:hypothetical protein
MNGLLLDQQWTDSNLLGMGRTLAQLGGGHLLSTEYKNFGQ